MSEDDVAKSEATVPVTPSALPATPSTAAVPSTPSTSQQGDANSSPLDSSSLLTDASKGSASQLASLTPSKASPSVNFGATTSSLKTPEKEKGKDEEEPPAEEDEEAREPSRFNDVEKSMLSTGFKAYMKKKLPDVITVEDAITVFRGCQFVFCGDEVRRLNKEMNAGKPTMDEDMFFKIISKVHCATEEEMQASFEVVEVEELNKDLVDVPKLRTLLMADGERFNIAEWELFNLEIIPPPPEDRKKKKKKRIMIKKKLKKGEVAKLPPPPKCPKSYLVSIMPQLVVEVKIPELPEELQKKKKKKR